MIKLDKNEKELWQLEEEIYFMDNGKEYDVAEFMLTNQNVRAEYSRKVSLFKRETLQITIPLTADIQISYHDTEEDTIELVVDTNEQSYSFIVCYDKKKRCVKELDEFIAQVQELA